MSAFVVRLETGFITGPTLPRGLLWCSSRLFGIKIKSSHPGLYFCLLLFTASSLLPLLLLFLLALLLLLLSLQQYTLDVARLLMQSHNTLPSLTHENLLDLAAGHSIFGFQTISHAGRDRAYLSHTALRGK